SAAPTASAPSRWTPRRRRRCRGTRAACSTSSCATSSTACGDGRRRPSLRTTRSRRSASPTPSNRRRRPGGPSLSEPRSRAAPRSGGIEDDLRAAEQGDDPARGLVADLRVPDLSRASGVGDRRLAGDRALEQGAEVIGFYLDRREAPGAVRETGDRSVAARRLGERDDRRAVKVAVRRQDLLPEREASGDTSLHHLADLDADETGKIALPEGLPAVDRAR